MKTRRSPSDSGAPRTAVKVIACVLTGVALFTLVRVASSYRDRTAHVALGTAKAEERVALGTAISTEATAARATRPFRLRLQPEAEPKAEPPPAPEARPQPRLIAMKPTPAQQRLLYEAEQRGVSDCMREQGFDYAPEPFTSNEELAGPNPRPVPGDLDAAASRGYGIADSLEYGDVPAAYDVNAARREHLSPERRAAYEAALMGEPEGTPAAASDTVTVAIPGGPVYRWNSKSCYSRARTALYGNEARYVELDNARVDLTNRAHSLVQAHPDYTQALDRWRECMQREQPAFADPAEVMRALKADYRSGKLSLIDFRTRETDLAVADAKCFRTAELGLVSERLEASVQGEVATSAAETVAAFEAVLQGALARASGPGPG